MKAGPEEVREEAAVHACALYFGHHRTTMHAQVELVAAASLDVLSDGSNASTKSEHPAGSNVSARSDHPAPQVVVALTSSRDNLQCRRATTTWNQAAVKCVDVVEGEHCFDALEGQPSGEPSPTSTSSLVA